MSSFRFNANFCVSSKIGKLKSEYSIFLFVNQFFGSGLGSRHTLPVTCHLSLESPLYAASGGLLMRLQKVWWLIEFKRKTFPPSTKFQPPQKLILIWSFLGRTSLTRSHHQSSIKSYTEGLTANNKQHTDIATYWLNWPMGRFSENTLILQVVEALSSLQMLIV